MRPKYQCKNHSERLTSKKCFHCQEYVCSSCQLIWSHHIFCGIYCYIKYQFFKFFDHFKLRKPHIVVLSIVMVMQIFTILIIWKIIHVNLPIKAQAEKQFSEIQTVDSTSFFTLDTTSQPYPYKLLISGKTLGNTLLGLWHNGKFVQSVIGKNNKYEFNPLGMILGENKFKIFRLDPLGKAVLVDSIMIYYKSPKIAKLMKSVSRINTSEKILSLTFDAGSINTGGEEILKILKEYRVKTTFFLTGRFIRKNIKLTSEILNSGHEIGNHTYSHPHLTQIENSGIQTTLTGINREVLQKELLATDSVFYSKFNKHLAPFWRAPFGEYNKEILQWAAELGYRHIRWSRNGDTMDWVVNEESELYRSSDQIYEDIMKLESSGELNGAILLMHFGTDRDSDYPYLILPKLIRDLQKKNYVFLSISKLLESTYIN